MAEQTKPTESSFFTRKQEDTLLATAYGVSSVLDVYGSFYEGFSKEERSKYNAANLRASADEIIKIGKLNNAQFERSKKAYIAAQQTGFMKNNVAINGSALDVITDTISQLELEQSLKKAEYKSQAVQRESQARLYDAEAKSGQQQAIFGGVATGAKRLYGYFKEFY